MKPFDNNDRDEAAVIEFFQSRQAKRGWTVENPAPSIPRVSCYVLDRGTVHVTEYKGCSISVLIQSDAIHTGWGPLLTKLQTLDNVDEIGKLEERKLRARISELERDRHLSLWRCIHCERVTIVDGSVDRSPGEECECGSEWYPMSRIVQLGKAMTIEQVAGEPLSGIWTHSDTEIHRTTDND